MTVFNMEYDFTVLLDKVQYVAYGKEVCPKTKRDHYQAFAYSKVAQRWSWWQKTLYPNSFRFCKGNLQQNEAYCSKDGLYTELGVKPMGDGKRRDLAEFCDAVVTKKQRLNDVALDNPTVFVQYNRGLSALASIVDNKNPYEHSGCRGVWIYGPPGSGKSHYARHNYQDVYVKLPGKWFDGYSGQKTILLEDVDNPSMSYFFKIWADKWSCTGEVKGATIQLRHHHFVVTSNYTIEQLFAPTCPVLAQAILRRFHVIHLPTVYKEPSFE